jgi:hypothetical protein
LIDPTTLQPAFEIKEHQFDSLEVHIPEASPLYKFFPYFADIMLHHMVFGNNSYLYYICNLGPLEMGSGVQILRNQFGLI